MIKKAVKKPVQVQVLEWTGSNLQEMKEFCGDCAVITIHDAAWQVGAGRPFTELTIKTLEGNMRASYGDYIIRGVKGELYPCKPDIFDQTYSLIPGERYFEIIGTEVEFLLDGVWRKAKICNGYRTGDGIINVLFEDGTKGFCGTARHREFVREIVR